MCLRAEAGDAGWGFKKFPMRAVDVCHNYLALHMNGIACRVWSRRLSDIVLLLVAVATASCGGSTRWEETPIDGPWVAPGVQAREFHRTRSPLSSPREEVVTFWTDAKGRRVEVFEIINSAMRYLEELGYFRRWPKTNRGINDYIQRLAPFTFHLVSTQPTIIVMVPHDFGKANDGRSNSEMVGRPPKQAADTKYMINYIEFGTTFPFHPEALWFSPDLRVPPTNFVAGIGVEQMIVQPGIKLLITKQVETCKTRRE